MVLLLALVACTGKPPTDGGDDTAESGETGESGESGETGGGGPACLSAEHRYVLADWLHQSFLVAYGAPPTATAETFVGFYQLPGVPASPWFNFASAAACDDFEHRDPVCTGSVCYQVDCTGKGGGWIDNIENAEDVPESSQTDFDGWLVDRGRIDLAWADGSGVLTAAYDLRGLTAPDGTSWVFDATATFDGNLDLHAVFPDLHPEGPATLDVIDNAGTLTVGGAEVAVWDGTNVGDAEGCVAGG